jgi:hypothetical protein
MLDRELEIEKKYYKEVLFGNTASQSISEFLNFEKGFDQLSKPYPTKRG